ncbi:MAG: antibiotic biosynthesis monooxygenase [Alphaproteobacteria bacterium]|nr:MAG: antibiotic biosynthesis monooxygenase [Alphaproteobacteria bacterium]
MAGLFEPPYFAVIFSSVRSGADAEGYGDMADRMMDLAATQDGYLGVETVSNGGQGITISYWRDEASIAQWRRHAEHQLAQKYGREKWYQSFRLRVAKVERERAFP